MIKAGAMLASGRPMLVLGLSRRNTELLLEGKPIRIDPSEDGIAGPVILIMGGETEQEILTELRRVVPGPAWKADPDAS